jgi:hypothetical protein
MTLLAAGTLFLIFRRLRAMSTKPTLSEGKELIKMALNLSIPIDDLLTTDGAEIAWMALKDFKVPINGVLSEFRKGDLIREWYLIDELRNSRCPVASVEPELWRRVQISKTPPEILTLKPSCYGMSIDLKELIRRVRAHFTR